MGHGRRGQAVRVWRIEGERQERKVAQNAQYIWCVPDLIKGRSGHVFMARRRAKHAHTHTHLSLSYTREPPHEAPSHMPQHATPYHARFHTDTLHATPPKKSQTHRTKFRRSPHTPTNTHTHTRTLTSPWAWPGCRSWPARRRPGRGRWA